MLPLLAGACRVSGQGLPVMVILDPITVGSLGLLGITLRPLLDAQIKNQEKQINLAGALNRSIGAWQTLVPEARSPHLGSSSLASEYTVAMRQAVVWDNSVSLPASLHTLHGAAVNVTRDDIADPARLDQVGAATQKSLAALANEIESTQQEVAATYQAMTGRGLSQQKYEKLRGKMQTLNLHLENLQSQQSTALELLQGQETSNDNKHERDGMIAAFVQEANHKENVGSLKNMKFDALPWR